MGGRRTEKIVAPESFTQLYLRGKAPSWSPDIGLAKSGGTKCGGKPNRERRRPGRTEGSIETFRPDRTNRTRRPAVRPAGRPRTREVEAAQTQDIAAGHRKSQRLRLRVGGRAAWCVWCGVGCKGGRGSDGVCKGEGGVRVNKGKQAAIQQALQNI